MTLKRTVKQVTVSKMDENPHLAKLLQKNRWFGELPQDVLAELLSLARTRTLQDGEYVYAKDDEPDGLHGVISGSVRISNVGHDGREAILAMLSPGSWFGEISLFDGLPRSHDSVATGVTELLLIPRPAFHQMLERRPELYPLFIRLLCGRARISFAMLEDSALLPLSSRLAKRLLMHGHNYGQTDEGGGRLSVQLSQEALGQMLNTSRQSINKQLKKMEQSGWISVHYSQITILDESALTRVASGTENLS